MVRPRFRIERRDQVVELSNDVDVARTKEVDELGRHRRRPGPVLVGKLDSTVRRASLLKLRDRSIDDRPNVLPLIEPPCQAEIETPQHLDLDNAERRI